MSAWKEIFQKIDDYRWRIPSDFREGMLVDGIVYTDEGMLKQIFADNAYLQVVNVACLPGIVGAALAMPDIHYGYGFPIGGVAAFDPDNGGVISPGGVGFDINCGVRVLRTDLVHREAAPKMKTLVEQLAREVPSGVGSEGTLTLSFSDLDELMVKGAKWAVEHGYGDKDDLAHTEENGVLPGADPSLVSRRAKERGAGQQGTLGSGNHFLEVQVVEEIFDEKTAGIFGLFKDQITIMIHSGSRGFGHQVCADYISLMEQAVKKYDISLPDRQLCCAPVNSPEGKDYFAAMTAAANYAWANRQMLMHWTRDSFARALGASPAQLRISLIYDVAHNIAKMEKHKVAGSRGKGQEEKSLCVHRKGATRAFPGNPVLVPGDMGRYSYVLVGNEKAMEETWGSVCHGAGRRMSRAAAARKYSVNRLLAELEKRGVVVISASRKDLVEEAPEAYKDVREVVEVVHNAGLAKKVARLRPLGVVKG